MDAGLVVNSPLLIEACRTDDSRLVKVLVDKGYRLRLEAEYTIEDMMPELTILLAMSCPSYIMARYQVIANTLGQLPLANTLGQLPLDTLGQLPLANDFPRSTLTSQDHKSQNPQDRTFQVQHECMVHFECNDPILYCFNICKTATDKIKQSPEFSDEFMGIVDKIEKVSNELLSQCKTMDEVQLILSDNAGTNRYIREPSWVRYPRMKMALEMNQKTFIGHPACQKLLRHAWLGNVAWEGQSTLCRLLHAAAQLIFTPVFIATYCFKITVEDFNKYSSTSCKFLESLQTFTNKHKIFTNLDQPINRFISYSLSQMIILWLLLEAVISPLTRFNPWSHPTDLLNLSWYHKGLLIMAPASIYRDLEDIYTLKVFRFDFWKIYRILNHVLILAALILQTHLHYEQKEFFAALHCDPYLGHNCREFHDPAQEYQTEIMWSNAMFSVATIISVIHILYWLLLDAKVGPLVLSASKIVTDVFTISIMYVIILAGFASGLMFIIGTEMISQAIYNHHINGTDVADNIQDDEISSMTRTIYTTLFWSLFDPGQSDLELKDSVRGIVARFLVGIYEVMSVIIFLNLLIAVMNASVQKVEDRKQVYWKFATTRALARFIDKNHGLPPPFNVLNIVRYVYCFFLRVIFNTNDPMDSHTPEDFLYFGRSLKRERKRRELMMRLIERYKAKQGEDDLAAGINNQIKALKISVLKEIRELLTNGNATTKL